MATTSTARGRGWVRAWALLAVAGLSMAPSAVLAGDDDPPPPAQKPAQKQPAAPKPPAAPALRCTLLTVEAPRGGLLEVEGAGFGKAPLVRIAGRVTRMIERTETKISVQIHADSDGGAVTVHAGKLQAACGTLTITGKNG